MSEPTQHEEPVRVTGHDRMEAERLTGVLGWIVTPEQVAADRLAQDAQSEERS